MNAKNFLIQESAISAEPVIQKSNKDTVEFIAIMQEADKPNRNGRIYYKTVLEQALESPYVKERLRTNSFYCEAGHPTDTSVQRQMTIDQRNIAAIVKEFWWEGNLLKARVETANTSVGRDMKGLIEQGSRVAFSLRAQGNVHHDARLNATIVESPIQIATYDWVVNPSHDRAFLETICEDTKCSMFGSKSNINSLALAESVSLFESGRMIPLNEVSKQEVLDLAKHYSKKIKSLSEAYVHSPKDNVVIDGKFAILTNDNVTKKVVLEDFLLKDIRHRVLKLNEEEAVVVSPEEAEMFVKPEGQFKKARKNAMVNYKIYDADGEEQTLEGPVKYQKGHYQLTGSKGEKWPVLPEIFTKRYMPIEGTTTARAKGEALVIPISKKYKVPLYGGSETLIANPETDLVLDYGMTDKGVPNYGVIKKDIFNNTYEYFPEENQTPAPASVVVKEDVPADADEKLWGDYAARQIKKGTITPNELADQYKAYQVNRIIPDEKTVPASQTGEKKLEEQASSVVRIIEINGQKIGVDEKGNIVTVDGETPANLSEEAEVVEVPKEVEAEVMVSDDSIRIEIPTTLASVDVTNKEQMENIKEATFLIHNLMSNNQGLNESTLPKSEISIREGKITLDIPLGSTKQSINEAERVLLKRLINIVNYSLLNSSINESSLSEARPIDLRSYYHGSRLPWKRSMGVAGLGAAGLGINALAPGFFPAAGGIAAAAAPWLAGAGAVGAGVVGLGSLFTNSGREWWRRNFKMGADGREFGNIEKARMNALGTRQQIALQGIAGAREKYNNKLGADRQAAIKAGRGITAGNKFLSWMGGNNLTRGFANFLGNTFGNQQFKQRRASDRYQDEENRKNYLNSFTDKTNANYKALQKLTKGTTGTTNPYESFKYETRADGTQVVLQPKKDPVTGAFVRDAKGNIEYDSKPYAVAGEAGFDKFMTDLQGAGATAAPTATAGTDYVDSVRKADQAHKDAEKAINTNQGKYQAEYEKDIMPYETDLVAADVAAKDGTQSDASWALARSRVSESFGMDLGFALSILEDMNISEDEKNFVASSLLENYLVKNISSEMKLLGYPLNEEGVQQFLASGGIRLNDQSRKLLTEDIVYLETVEGSAAAEPVATSDSKPKEHTPEIENKDVFPAEEHKQAEEVKEVIVESKKIRVVKKGGK
jgi:hypothetical protein